MNEEPEVINHVEFDEALRERCATVSDDVFGAFALQLRNFLAELTFATRRLVQLRTPSSLGIAFPLGSRVPSEPRVA